MVEPDSNWIKIKVLEVKQPIGTFYFGTMDHKTLTRICYSDIRTIDTEKSDIESYLGIERPLRSDRVRELREYVNTVDATFPSSIILAIKEEDAKLDAKTGEMSIRNDDDVAKILDGQHRIAGLREFTGEAFDVLVTIFVDMDMEYQAMVFAIINLEQTKVNRSLAYDLYAFATTRSPHKTCHNVVRLLNDRNESPFQNKIKILGFADERSETISQALYVDSLLPMISTTPYRDRDNLKRGRTLSLISKDESRTLIFRNFFVENQDGLIARVLWNYFKAVELKWGIYWTDVKPGIVLNRTTGFRGLMEFLPMAFVAVGGLDGDPAQTDFSELLERIEIGGHEISTDNYLPGTAGSTKFRNDLRRLAGI